VDSTTVWNNHTWSAIGRLRAGMTAADAEAELAPLTARLHEEFPQVYGPTFVTGTGFRTEVRALRDVVVGDMVTRALWALFGSVALVLLIAGANVANLFLLRTDGRRHDVAVRTALGAARGHLAVQYLTESLILALVSAVLALGIAQGMLRVLLAIAPSELPRLADVRLGAASVAFALGAALLTGLIFGLLPLLGGGAKMDVAMLRDAGRGLTTSRPRMFARHVLIAAQMAFGVVLLASAVLMLRTFQNLRAVRPGFDPSGVLTLEIALPGMRYGRDANLASTFHEQLTARVLGLPGVTAAGLTSRLPLVSSDWCTAITIEGPTPETARGTCPPSTSVSPGYFEAIGTRVEGRTLTWRGMNANDGAVVTSKAFAEHHWPGESPIGKGVRFNGRNPPWYRIVGIAEDVRGMGVDAPPTEAIYFPIRPMPDAPLWGAATNMHLVVKMASGDPTSLAKPIARIVAELDPQAAVANPRTMDALLARSIAKQSFTTVLLLICAVIAMLLSAVGIYGVISYVVAQRRSEIGVRVALGAGVRQVTTMVLRQALGVAAVGVVVGVLASVATTRLLRTLLFGVSPGDPLTLAIVPAILLLVATLASYAPARRAAMVNPVDVMRSE